IRDKLVTGVQTCALPIYIQEERAAALWKIATGAASIVVAPVSAAAIRLRSPEYYGDLARTVRRAETIDVEALIQQLNKVGYAARSEERRVGKECRSRWVR